MKHKEFPDECIRGVSSRNDLVENNTVILASAFQFQKERFNDKGWIEESINWKDDKHAVNFTLNLKKKNTDKFQFVAIACIPRGELDSLKKMFPSVDAFNYERDPKENVNEYHGNLLMRKDVSNQIKGLIRHSLARHCKDIIMRENL